MRARGMALITVLLVMSVVAICMLSGIQITGKNLLFLSGVHRNHLCLGAAEAGVYAAIQKLEDDPGYAGPLQSQLRNGARFRVTVTHAGQQVTLVSVGTFDNASRTVRVTLGTSSDSYPGLACEGHVGVGMAFVNGIRSTANPLPDKGNLHTNSAGDPAIDAGRLSITGEASAVGSISGTVDGKKKPNDDPVTLGSVNKAALLTGTFTEGNVPANGVISGKRRFKDGEITDLVMEVPLVLQPDAVLHVTGDCILKKGVVGSGTLVCEGNVLIRGNEKVDLNNSKGVVVYAEKDLTVTHPLAAVDLDSERFEAPVDEIGDYFARMPSDAPYILGQRLPADAPIGIDFFNWYRDQSGSLPPSFTLWRDGDGTELNPGLPPNVRTWLQDSLPLNQQLNNWVNS